MGLQNREREARLIYIDGTEQINLTDFARMHQTHYL